MKYPEKKTVKRIIVLAGGVLLVILALAGIAIARTRGRTLIQIDIHQNKKLIHLSNFAEPPQFAVWLENRATGELRTVFVTHRTSKGDWEGKANVPVSLPLWFKLFRENKDKPDASAASKAPDMAITGATPKSDYFSVRVEVKPGTEWICWIEMNLAGDFNDAYPEVNLNTLKEDVFSNGQPALIFRAEVKAVEGMKFKPEIVSQSTWNKGEVTVAPVSDGVTTAREVFDDVKISVIRPKPKLIDKNRIQDL